MVVPIGLQIIGAVSFGAVALYCCTQRSKTNEQEHVPTATTTVSKSASVAAALAQANSAALSSVSTAPSTKGLDVDATIEAVQRVDTASEHEHGSNTDDERDGSDSNRATLPHQSSSRTTPEVVKAAADVRERELLAERKVRKAKMGGTHSTL